MSQRLVEGLSYQHIAQQFGVSIDQEISPLHYPDKVIYAGTSPRRLEWLRRNFPGTEVVGISADPEPPNDDVKAVMAHKVGKIHEGLPVDPNKVEIILGADTRTVTPVFTEEGVVMQSKGKPKNLHEVFETFQKMQQAASAGIDPPHYKVQNAAGMLYRNTAIQFFAVNAEHIIVLTEEGITHLSTYEGLAQYVRGFQKFYQPPLYKQKVGTDDVSGGISLPVLVRLGWIKSIDGIDATQLYFPEAFANAVFSAAIGFSPRLLKLVGVNEDEIIAPGSWINQVVKRGLNNTI